MGDEGRDGSGRSGKTGGVGEGVGGHAQRGRAAPALGEGQRRRDPQYADARDKIAKLRSKDPEVFDAVVATATIAVRANDRSASNEHEIRAVAASLQKTTELQVQIEAKLSLTSAQVLALQREREKFSSDVRSLHQNFVLHGRKGLCPGGCTTLIVDHGARIVGDVHWHHVDGNPSKTDKANACPLCARCHVDQQNATGRDRTDWMRRIAGYVEEALLWEERRQPALFPESRRR